MILWRKGRYIYRTCVKDCGKVMRSHIRTFLSFILLVFSPRNSRYMHLFELQSFPIYWHTRDRKEKIKLTLGRWRFKIRTRWSGSKETFHIGVSIAATVIRPTVIALLVITLLFISRHVPSPQPVMASWLQTLLGNLERVMNL